MRRILHILKDTDQPEALEIIDRQAGDPELELSILLIQEAVRLIPSLRTPVLVLEEDLIARGLSSTLRPIKYPQMLEMIFSADQVIAW